MKMASLKLVDNVPGINYYEYRDREFFSKFKYRARVTFHGLALTYYAGSIDEYLVKLDNASYRWRKLDKNKIKSNLDPIEKFIEFKKTIKSDKKFVVRTEGDTSGIFSNDLNKLLELKQIQGIEVDFTEAITSSFVGVKYFVREPKHKYRIYLRSKLIEPGEIDDLKNILSQNKALYPSRALIAWLYRTRQSSWHYRYVSSCFSIDYDDESTISYLGLMLGQLLGHKYKLEKHPDPI